MDDDTNPGLAISPLMQFRKAKTHDTLSMTAAASMQPTLMRLSPSVYSSGLPS